MKEALLIIGIMAVAMTSQSQIVRGSVRQGSAPNQVEVVYLPDHNTTAGEYVQYLAVSVAIPTSVAAGVTPTITGSGIFSGLSFSPASPFTYSHPSTSETIYSWVVTNNNSFVMSWSSGVQFVGAVITFNGAPGATKVRMVDFFANGGGDNFNTTFNVGVNIPPFDLTDYTNFFFQLGGANGSTPPTPYGDGNIYVETNQLISLPVSLINFSGYKNGAKNTLNWTVSSEVNNRGFDVQRSTDGVNYSSIGFVNSQVGGYTNEEQHYSFDDVNPSGKKQYYRLNQKDIDGNSKLSNVVMITRDKPTVLGIGGLFPNPARESVNVIIDAPQRDKITIVVTDMAGKTVIQQQTNVDLGSNTVPVNVAKLSNGSYLVKLLCHSSDCETSSAKFIKQ